MSKLIDGIVLSDLIELMLRNNSYVVCPDYIANKLHNADPLEQYVHIERPNAENELKNTRVWRAEEWRTSYAKWQRTKELSAKERQVAVLSSELRTQIVKRFIAMTGLDEDSALKTAAAIIRSRNEEICLKMFGIKLDELLKADLAYKDYKTKIGQK